MAEVSLECGAEFLARQVVAHDEQNVRVARVTPAERTNTLSKHKTTNTMNTELPPPIAAFFKAHNTRETDDFNALFTSDALVSDEAHEYRGTAIKRWIDSATAEYKPTANVTDLAQVGDKIVVTAQVSGTFPGSPVQLRYNFTLENDKIAALDIRP